MIRAAVLAIMATPALAATDHTPEPDTWSRPSTSPCAVSEADDNPCWRAPWVPDEVFSAWFAGDSTPTEICDGDRIGHNSYVVAGVAFRTGPQVVQFDRVYLRAKGIPHRIADGRACIPAKDYGGGWIKPHACQNALEGHVPASAASLVSRPPEYMRGGYSSVLTRTRSGAGAHVAAPLIPPVITWPGKPPVKPYEPPIYTPPGEHPPAPVPLPQSLGFMAFVFALIGAGALWRRA